jgi:catechol 2,3-dioxygenase-like lactoylglutathione lyase family enzyme
MNSATQLEVPGPAAHRMSVPHMVAGTMVTTDIAAARHFYEEFLGFECVRYAPDRLLLRDRYAAAEMAAGGDDFFVIDVQEVAEVSNPQRMLHHWGLDVATFEDVDRLHAVAKARKAEFGLSKVFPLADLHGAHSFYFSDRDSNWWEIEYRSNGLDNSGFFARGDFGSKERESWSDEDYVATRLVNPDAPEAQPGLIGNARLTHGTCEQLGLDGGRRFIEQVLQLRCVRHVEPGQMFAGRGEFGVFAIGLPRVKAQERQNRWVVSVANEAEVKATATRAEAERDDLRIGEIGPVEAIGTEVSVTIQDGDGNWWEVTTRQPSYYRALFAAGDVA